MILYILYFFLVIGFFGFFFFAMAMVWNSRLRDEMILSKRVRTQVPHPVRYVHSSFPNRASASSTFSYFHQPGSSDTQRLLPYPTHPTSVEIEIAPAAHPSLA
jgi:hypothetical protein